MAGEQQGIGRTRARDLGIVLGTLPTGPDNAITDVAGVRVGHSTLRRGSGPLVRGTGPVRTGVTAILPHGDDLLAWKGPAADSILRGSATVTDVCGFPRLTVSPSSILQHSRSTGSRHA